MGINTSALRHSSVGRISPWQGKCLPVQIWGVDPVICPGSLTGQSNRLLSGRFGVRVPVGVPYGGVSPKRLRHRIVVPTSVSSNPTIPPYKTKRKLVMNEQKPYKLTKKDAIILQNCCKEIAPILEKYSWFNPNNKTFVTSVSRIKSSLIHFQNG